MTARRFTVEQICRVFRVPMRIIIGGVPAKAAHKRKYGRG